MKDNLAKGGVDKSSDSSAEDEKLGASVLIVEDNRVNQTVARRMLEIIGCQVDIAENGKVGVDKAVAQKYDLILMDCMMPVMDGMQASAEIRQLEGDAASVPIVALTANALEEYRKSCFEAGMDDFMTKPVKMDTLRTAVKRWMSKRHEIDKLTPKPPEQED